MKTLANKNLGFLALIGMLLIGGVIISGCIEEPQRSGNIEFEYGTNESVGDTQEGIKDIEWDNDVLIIDAIITATCDDPNLIFMGDYKVDGNDISLTVSETKSGYKCMGNYDVKFKINNLKKRNYNILLFTDVMGQGKLLIDEKQLNKTSD